MKELTMCRVCLAEDIRMRLIANTHLQEMYECLSSLPLQTKDNRPIQVCYICCAGLQNCYRLRKRCRRSEELFTWILSSDVLQPLNVQGGCTLRVKHPVIHLSIGKELQNNTDDDNTEDSAYKTGTSHVFDQDAVEQEDIKMEPQKEYETEIDDDIQCSHLADTLDVMTRETDDVETDAEEVKLEIKDITIEENEPNGIYQSSQSAYNICPKIAKIVLERIVVNDTIPMTGVPALKKLGETDSLFETRPKNDNQSNVIDKLIAKSNKIHKNRHNEGTGHDETLKQTSKSNIRAIKKRFRSKAHLESYTFNKHDFKRQRYTHTDNKPYINDICKKQFPRKSPLTGHLPRHTVQERIQCDTCNKCFTKKSSLANHLNTHASEKRFQCNTCNKCFTKKWPLANHLKTHASENRFQCDTCNKCFTRKSSLVNHLKTHASENRFQCDTCNKCFTKKPSIINHLNTHACEKRFQCDTCNKCFTKKCYLVNHVYTHASEKRFQCDSCNKCFTVESSLINHLCTYASQKRFQCDMCNISFTFKCNLVRHKYSHATEKRYKCKICNKLFMSVRNLSRHVKIHSGEKRENREKPVQCHLCNRSFTKKSNLMRHLYTHTGEKRFQCNICNKRFINNSCLNYHLLSHASAKRFQCDTCNSYFKYKSSVKKHLNKYSGGKKLHCDVCNQCFCRKLDLTQHMYTHTGEKPFMGDSTTNASVVTVNR